MKKMPKQFRGSLRCSVKETQPYFLITDGSFFIQAYFTEKSYQTFRDNNSQLRITDLKDIMIQLNDWELELSVSSPDSFTSYAGLEMKMIIN